MRFGGRKCGAAAGPSKGLCSDVLPSSESDFSVCGNDYSQGETIDGDTEAGSEERAAFSLILGTVFAALMFAAVAYADNVVTTWVRRPHRTLHLGDDEPNRRWRNQDPRPSGSSRRRTAMVENGCNLKKRYASLVVPPNPP